MKNSNRAFSIDTHSPSPKTVRHTEVWMRQRFYVVYTYCHTNRPWLQLVERNEEAAMVVLIIAELIDCRPSADYETISSTYLDKAYIEGFLFSDSGLGYQHHVGDERASTYNVDSHYSERYRPIRDRYRHVKLASYSRYTVSCHPPAGIETSNLLPVATCYSAI